MITCYNPKAVGDCLMVILNDNHGAQLTPVTAGPVTKVVADNETVALNFFGQAEKLNLKGCGQIFLNETQVAQLNELLQAADFPERLTVDTTPKIVVGEVVTCVPHPDSDHLHITETKVSAETTLQIVCGAPNVEAGQKVVAATPGAMMPDGSLIFPGNLRGVASFGMLCSARELGVPNAPAKRGILVLAPETPVGTPFSVELA